MTSYLRFFPFLLGLASLAGLSAIARTPRSPHSTSDDTDLTCDVTFEGWLDLTLALNTDDPTTVELFTDEIDSTLTLFVFEASEAGVCEVGPSIELYVELPAQLDLAYENWSFLLPEGPKCTTIWGSGGEATDEGEASSSSGEHTVLCSGTAGPVSLSPDEDTDVSLLITCVRAEAAR